MSSSEEFDVLRALALGGDLTAAQSLPLSARKLLEQSVCPHDHPVDVTTCEDTHRRWMCADCGLWI